MSTELAGRLQARFHAAIKARHYALKTEKTYWHWIKRYLHFHALTHPNDHNEGHVERFLSDLAVRREVAPATQNIAFNALCFLFNQVFPNLIF